jgi:glycosyltransferase involved in cell wall biosynthesis
MESSLIMDLIIDGAIYRIEKKGGISRVFDNIIPLLCQLDTDIKVQMLKKGDFIKPIPLHQQISILDPYKWDQFIRPWRVWRKAYPAIHNFLTRQLLGNTQDKIWFSTYYTPPPVHWKGKQVVLVYDFVYEMYKDLMPNNARVINNKRNAILNADRVISISNTTASDMQKFYPISAEKIEVVHLSCDDLFMPRQRSEIRNLVSHDFILYVGSRRIYKGFVTLLNAYSAWQAKGDVKLIVVGRPWTVEESRFLDENSLSTDVLLFENCDDDALCDLYNQARAFIYPSLYEGFGIPLLEAMACACPIIASKIPSTDEVAGSVPMYFEPGDPEDLTKALNALNNKENLKGRVEQGIELIGKYSWKKTAEKIYSVLKSV